MPSSSNKISTIVRNFLKLYPMRLGFLIGSRLWPEMTAKRAVRLFCTPYASSRGRAIAAPTANAEECTLRATDAEIATYIWGDPHRQPYVLFAHGWSSHGTRIAAWVEPLRSAGYAVVAFDQAGHGKSSGYRTNLRDFADHVLEVGRHYGPAAAVIGHSLGGAAAGIALAHGLAAQRAILIAPVADPLAAMERFSRFIWMAGCLYSRMAAIIERETQTAIEALQAHRYAHRIACPALIVHDLEDREVPWAEGERYARFWRGARLVTTDGLGHHRIADHPTVIADSLRFLRSEPVGERVVSTTGLPFGLC